MKQPIKVVDKDQPFYLTPGDYDIRVIGDVTESLPPPVVWDNTQLQRITVADNNPIIIQDVELDPKKVILGWKEKIVLSGTNEGSGSFVIIDIYLKHVPILSLEGGNRLFFPYSQYNTSGYGYFILKLNNDGIYEIESKTQIAASNNYDMIRAAVLSPTGEKIYAASYGHNILVIETNTFTFSWLNNTVNSNVFNQTDTLALSSDGNSIAVKSGTNTFKVFDALNGEFLGDFSLTSMFNVSSAGNITVMKWLPNSNIICIGTASGQFGMYDVVNGVPIEYSSTIRNGSGPNGVNGIINQLCFSNDGKCVYLFGRITTSLSAYVAKFDILNKSYTLLGSGGMKDGVVTASISPNGKKIACGDNTGQQVYLNTETEIWSTLQIRPHNGISTSKIYCATVGSDWINDDEVIFTSYEENGNNINIFPYPTTLNSLTITEIV
jgi:WD40 repeat protein